MNKPAVGDAVRVIFPAEVIELKRGVVVCRVYVPGGPQIMRFGPDGQGHNGAKLKNAKRVGVKVAGSVE